MFKCLKCDQVFDDRSRICRSCGSILEPVEDAISHDRVGEEVPESRPQAPTADAVIVAEAIPPSPPKEEGSWNCRGCGAKVPGNFEVCWQCEQTRTSLNESSEEKHSSSKVSDNTTPIVAQASLICPKCGTDDVIPNLRVIDGHDGTQKSLELVIERREDATELSEPTVGELFANVCGRCGHTDFRVNNPTELLAAYRSGRGKT